MLYVWRLDEERGEFVSKSVNYEEAVRVRVQLMLDAWNVVEARARRALLSLFMSKQKRADLEREAYARPGVVNRTVRGDHTSGQGWLTITFEFYCRRRFKQTPLHRKVCVRPSVFRKAIAHQKKEPTLLLTWIPSKVDEIEKRFWWACDDFWISTGYSEEEARVLLWEKARREQRKFERLAKAMAAATQGREEARRERIPEEVRLLVWERDGGRCLRCGSTEELEFDHIIPVSKGGSSTEKNVQLLCAKCNREKSDRIA